MPEIVIAICTRERPKMLGDLLQSCISLARDQGAKPRFIVVESGPGTPSRGVIDDFSTKLPITYLHEPRIGVVYARNCAVNSFLKDGGDWLAFLDDDEVVDPGWFVAMVQAIAAHPSYKIFAGHAIMIEPDSAPLIFQSFKSSIVSRPRITERKAVTTQNVMFRRDIFAGEGHAMRFDLRFNTIGGSDYFLCYQLTDAGEKIRIVPDAITREHVLPERAAFRFRTRKMIAQAHHRGLMSLLRFGRLRGHAHNIWAALHALLRAIILAATGSLVLVFNERRGLQYFARAVTLFCTFLGRPRILWSQPVDIYKVVQGS